MRTRGRISRVARVGGSFAGGVLAGLSLAACASGEKLAKGPNARPVDAALVHALCTSEFAGDAASIQVWRQKDGTFVVFELQPDTGKHGASSPTSFFDEGGREVMRLASHGGSPGSPEALEADRKRESITVDGKKAEVLPCKGK